MSKVEIYYFSGTGNSLAVARDIAGRINGQLIPIPSVMAKDSINTDADVIGIVFPVYYIINEGLPLIIGRFIRKLENLRSKYIFAVCTCAGSSGLALENLSKMIRVRGGKLAGGFTVIMPSNVSSTAKEKQLKLINNWQRKLEIIADYVKARREDKVEKVNILLRLISISLLPLLKPLILGPLEKLANASKLTFNELIPLIDHSYHPSAECDGCGICTKVCPVSNIEMIDNRPSWRHHCETCLACFHWCPKEAVQGGLAAKMKKYHHPAVKLSDMLTPK